METVTIEHGQWGRVEGVKPGYFGHSPGIKGWEKDGCVRFEIDGWREVKPTRWMPVPVLMREKEFTVHLQGVEHTYRLTSGYRWKTVEIEREVEG